MKKITALILVVIILSVSFSFSVSAQFAINPEIAEIIGCLYGDYAPRVEPANENYPGNMLKNEYYKTYYNELLDISYNTFRQFEEHIRDIDYISYYADNYMNKDINYVTLIFSGAIIPMLNGSVSFHNKSVLQKYFNKDEILYVSDYYSCAVVEISKEKKDIVKEIEELAFIGDAFFIYRPYYTDDAGEFTLGNVTGSQTHAYHYDPVNNVTAADARMILRFSAKLEKPEKELKRFYFCADMNFDGKINSADARLALRTSAKLEKEYVISFGSGTRWSDGI